MMEEEQGGTEREEELKILIARTSRVLKRANGIALSRREARKIIEEELRRAIFSPRFRDYLWGLIEMKMRKIIERKPRTVIKKVHVPIAKTVTKRVVEHPPRPEFKPIIDRETMLKHVGEGLTDDEIAERHGMTYNQVKYLRLKRHRILKQHRIDPKELHDIKKMYENGTLVKEIGKKFKINGATVLQRLGRYFPNMEFRGKGGKFKGSMQEQFIKLVKEGPITRKELKAVGFSNPHGVYKRLIIKGWAIRRLVAKDDAVYYVEQMRDRALQIKEGLG